MQQCRRNTSATRGDLRDHVRRVCRGLEMLAGQTVLLDVNLEPDGAEGSVGRVAFADFVLLTTAGAELGPTLSNGSTVNV